MINFARLLGISSSEEQIGTLESALSSALKDLPDDRVSYLTGIAGLLGKVAGCDLHFSKEEELVIRDILTNLIGLHEHEASAVCDLLSKVTADLAGLEDYRYSRILNEAIPVLKERRELLAALFEVAAADGTISAEEDHVIGQIANSLRLTRRDYVDIRFGYKDKLSLFQS